MEAIRKILDRCNYFGHPDYLEPNKTYITESLIINSVKSNDYSTIKDAVVISMAAASDYISLYSGEKAQDIRFGDDIWTNKFCRTSVNETIRRVNFNRIKSPRIRMEVKIVCAANLWVTGHKAKLSSLIRKFENIVLIAEVIDKQNYISFFNIDHVNVYGPVLGVISVNPKTGRKKAVKTVRNFLLSLSSVSALKESRLAEIGYYLETDFVNEYQAQDDTNQTFCMPFSILMSVWSGYISYFEGLQSKFEFDKFEKLMRFYNGFYSSKYFIENKKSKFIAHLRSRYYYHEGSEYLKELYESDSEMMRGFISRREGRKSDVKSRWYEECYVINAQALRVFQSDLTKFTLHTIQAMTGMRTSEVRGIYHDGLIDDKGRIGIESTLQKFAKEGGQTDVWAAASFVKVAFNILYRVNKAMLCITDEELYKLPLSINMQKWLSSRTILHMGTFRDSEFTNQISLSDEFIITDEDMNEFNMFNPNIGNSERLEDLIYEGARWPLRSHQYRRSIAVHSRRLNLVTSNVIAQQFKHLATTQSEWYMSGADDDKTRYTIPKAFADELQKMDQEFSASLAVKFQNSDNLIGEGGKQLMKQQELDDGFKTYPSYKKALSMAKRGGSKLVSLGNGFYCMNGTECDFKAVIQSSSCNNNCPNLVSDSESVPIWRKRYRHYQSLYGDAINNNEPFANVVFFQLEMEFYKKALVHYGVFNNEE
jgi:hypothetical protein